MSFMISFGPIAATVFQVGTVCLRDARDDACGEELDFRQTRFAHSSRSDNFDVCIQRSKHGLFTPLLEQELLSKQTSKPHQKPGCSFTRNYIPARLLSRRSMAPVGSYARESSCRREDKSRPNLGSSPPRDSSAFSAFNVSARAVV